MVSHVKVSADGKEEEVGDEEGRDAEAHQVGEPQL